MFITNINIQNVIMKDYVLRVEETWGGRIEEVGRKSEGDSYFCGLRIWCRDLHLGFGIAQNVTFQFNNNPWKEGRPPHLRKSQSNSAELKSPELTAVEIQSTYGISVFEKNIILLWSLAKLPNVLTLCSIKKTFTICIYNKVWKYTS